MITDFVDLLAGSSAPDRRRVEGRLGRVNGRLGSGLGIVLGPQGTDERRVVELLATTTDELLPMGVSDLSHPLTGV